MKKNVYVYEFCECMNMLRDLRLCVCKRNCSILAVDAELLKGLSLVYVFNYAHKLQRNVESSSKILS